MFWLSRLRPFNDRSRAERANEETEQENAVSLSESFKRPYGYRFHTFNDNRFGRASFDRLNTPSHLSFVPTEHYTIPREFHQREYRPRAKENSRVCAGCHCKIDYGSHLRCMGSFFHPECFRCHACGRQISEQEFSSSGSQAYHKSCFRGLNHPKCDVCHRSIPTNAAGLIEYRSHPFWSQKYCPSHDNENIAKCCSCERLESPDAKYIFLGDGRKLCLECMESAIMDRDECNLLYHSIRDFYEGMNMKIKQEIPMLLVERQALNEAIAVEKQRSLHHMPETRGLCISEEQTVTSISKGPMKKGQRLVGMIAQPQKLTRQRHVNAILVLYGLPRLLVGSIIAHELMHAWMRLNGFPKLSLDVEEGICQVIAYLWLESEVMPEVQNMASASSSSSSVPSKGGRKSSTESKLGKFFLHQIATDTSPAYGEGYRAASAAVNRFGLHHTLKSIRDTGTLPMY